MSQLIRLLNRFSVGMTAVVDRAAGTDYASNAEILCIVAIGRSDSPSLGDLMAVSNIPRRSVSSLVACLERSGVVRKVTSHHDRREVLVQVTKSGRREFKRMSRDLEEFFTESRPLAGEIVDVLGPLAAGTFQRPPPIAAIELLERAATAGVELNTAVERHADDRLVSGRRQLAVLYLSADGMTRAGRLAERIGVTSGGLTYIVDQLEKKGLVHRVYGAHGGDGRAVEISLTQEGEDLARDIAAGFLTTARTLAQLFATIRDRV